MKKILMAALAAAALVAAPGAVAKPRAAEAAEAQAQYTIVQSNARVPFYAQSTRGYTVARDRSLILRGTGDRWYRATLYEPCASMVSNLSRVRFETRPAEVLDRWAHVRVNGVRCPIRRFDQIERPTRS